jgi:hypothetical protein
LSPHRRMMVPQTKLWSHKFAVRGIFDNTP